jgi:putative membrane protein
MIVKRSLSPRRVVEYTARPMAWVLAWGVAAPLLYELTDDERLVLPFAPVGALAAALAILIAFRNNTAFSRWNEARSAWQSIVVACRALMRQIGAATENAATSGAVEREAADGFMRESALRLAAFAHVLSGSVRPPVDWGHVASLVESQELERLRSAANPATACLARQSVRIKDAIREGALGQFDPISLEPQLVALGSAQGVVERIKHTPTPRQYDYFTRRILEVFAVLAPFGILSLVPEAIWWTVPLAVVLSGVFVVLAVTGAANDDPFENRVTDVPLATICAELERDLRALVGERDLPPVPQPVDGYLW